MKKSVEYEVMSIDRERHTVEVSFHEDGLSTAMNMPLPMNVESPEALRAYILQMWPHQFFTLARRPSVSQERHEALSALIGKKIETEIPIAGEQPAMGDPYAPFRYEFDAGAGLARHEHTYDHDLIVERGKVFVVVVGREPFYQDKDSPRLVLPANIKHSITATVDGTSFTTTRV